MNTPRRMPLQDLPLEPFIIPNIVTGSKTPRKHKRPLSPSRATPLNPAKRRVLDVEGVPPPNNVPISPRSPVPFMLSNMHAVTPTRPSRLGNGLVRNHGRSQETLSPWSSYHVSPSHELHAKPTIESSTDPQSKHYPGFSIFRDSEHRRSSPTPRVSLPSESNGVAPANRCEEDKENIPLRRRAKRLSSKKRFSCAVGLDASCFVTPTQPCKAIAHPDRTPLSARQALR